MHSEREKSQEVNMGVLRFEGMVLEETPKRIGGARSPLPDCATEVDGLRGRS